MDSDIEHAEDIRLQVEKLNVAIVNAARAGLVVEIEIQLLNIFGKSPNMPSLHYHVARTVKRG